MGGFLQFGFWQWVVEHVVGDDTGEDVRVEIVSVFLGVVSGYFGEPVVAATFCWWVGEELGEVACFPFDGCFLWAVVAFFYDGVEFLVGEDVFNAVVDWRDGVGLAG